MTEVPLGAPVGVEICIGCGICRHCKVGRVNLCEKLEELGVTVDGGMTELVAVPARNVHVPPGGAPFEAAVFADPLACVIRGLEMITVTSGSWVAVLGPGQMGLLATQVIKRILRARVVVIGTRDDRLAIAREMGADEVINLRERDAVAAVRDLTDGGADFVNEAAGTAEALGQAIAMARKGGSVVMLTVHKRSRWTSSRRSGASCTWWARSATPIGSTSGLSRSSLGVGGRRSLMQRMFPLGQAQEAFEFVMSRQGVKAILVLPGGEGSVTGSRVESARALGVAKEGAMVAGVLIRCQPQQETECSTPSGNWRASRTCTSCSAATTWWRSSGHWICMRPRRSWRASGPSTA